MKKQTIITIARQYGSGGREIGKRLATELGISFYDRELLTEASKKYNIDMERMEEVDERPGDRYLYFNPITSQNLQESFLSHSKYLTNDDVTQAQFCTILQIAKTGQDCVFIGRCADHVLKGWEGKLSLYIYADFDTRVHRIMERENLDERTAYKAVKKMDKIRANYYNYFTDMEWGDIDNYDMCLNVSKLGIDQAVSVIKNYIQGV